MFDWIWRFTPIIDDMANPVFRGQGSGEKHHAYIILQSLSEIKFAENPVRTTWRPSLVSRKEESSELQRD